MGDGRRSSHSLPHHWLEFCDEISGKSTTGGGDPIDRAHYGFGPRLPGHMSTGGVEGQGGG
jgi:hypothetical protein